jgi:hypothetical protein
MKKPVNTKKDVYRLVKDVSDFEMLLYMFVPNYINIQKDLPVLLL